MLHKSETATCEVAAQGDGDEAMEDSRQPHSSVSMPPPASRRCPDRNETYCPHCLRVVIRRRHQSRCEARKEAGA
jgi:hypothetical protein